MFVIFGGLLVLLLTAALVAPLFIDWTGYRANFEAEASKILGRPVTVAGAASARLLPFPSVTFEDVRVGEDQANPVLTMDRFSMDAELAPFLSGEVLIFDMRVSKPRGAVTVHADGTTDWALRPDSPFNASQVRIENMVIDSGQIDIVDEGADAKHRLAIVDAVVSARALTGPWRVNGQFAFDGEPLAVVGSTGQVGEDGALPLRLQLFPTQRGLAIEADGSALAVGGKLTYAGSFGLRPAGLTDPSGPALRGSDGKAAGAEEAFRVSGKFMVDSAALTVPELRLETGDKADPYIANGKGSVSFGLTPRFDVTIDGTQVTFNDKGDKVSAGSGVASRVAAFRTFVDSVPVPTMPGRVVVNLPAIVAGDTTIREVAFNAEPEGDAWRVEGFRSTLPGRTRLEADGLLSRGDGFGFRGNLLVASSQPAGLANWLTGEVDPAIRKLSAAGFSAKADLSPVVQKFDDLEVALGGASLKGSAERRTDGARPTLEVVLKGGALDLDALAAMGSGLFTGKGDNRLGGHDLSATLDVGPVRAGTLEADGLGISVRLKQDRADIDRLMISGIAGASISATGTLTGFPDKTSASIDASLVSVDGAEFVAKLAERFVSWPVLATASDRIASTPGVLNDFQASIVAATAPEGDMRAWSLSGNAKAASGNASFSGSGKGNLAAPQDVTGNWQASIQQDEPLNFLTFAGVSLIPLGAPGPATLDINATGGLRDGLAIETAYAAEGTTATLAGILKAGSTFEGKAGLISNDLDPYLLATGFAFPGSGFGTPASFAADVTKAGDVVTFAGLDASVSDVTAKGDLTLDLGERSKVDGTLAVNAIEVPWLLESLTGAGTFTPGNGATAFSAQPFVPVDGKIMLTAETAWLGPLGESTAVKALLVLQPGSLRLEQFKTRLSSGTLTGTFEARNNSGDGSVSGDFAIKGSRFGELTGQAALNAAADISGSLSATGKSADGLASALTGSGVISLKGGSIAGINPDGFTALLAAAGGSDKAPDDAAAKVLVASNMLAGTFPFQDTSVAWTVAGGRLRIPAFRGVSENAVVFADLSGDVADVSVTIDGSVAYDAGNEAVTGAETSVPFRLTYSAEGASFETDALPVTQYLTQRALEREQARVEAMQAALIEKQRLRRDAKTVQLAYAERDYRAARREAALREAARKKGEEAQALWNVEKARIEAEEKARREADAKAKADAELKAEEEAAKAAEAKRAAAAAKALEQAPLVTPVDPSFAAPPQAQPDLPKLDLSP